MEERRRGASPLTFTMNGSKLVQSLQAVGLNTQGLNLRDLVEGSAHGFEIQELESRLQAAAAVAPNGVGSVEVTVTYQM